MKKFALTAALATGLTLSACATNDPYGYNNGYYGQPAPSTQRTLGGAAAGAAGGALIGALIPGVSLAEGAIAGAVLGGVVGAVTKDTRWNRTTDGRCYAVDPVTGRVLTDSRGVPYERAC